MASKTTRNVLIGSAAVVVVGAGVAFFGVSNQPEEKIEPQNYVPTAEDIAHAEQVAADFYGELNAGRVQLVKDLIETSIDGQGLIIKPQGDIYEIRTSAPQPVLFETEPKETLSAITTRGGIYNNQDLWNTLLDPEMTQEKFDEKHVNHLAFEMPWRMQTVSYGPLAATYNIASGRVCEIKAEILNNDKYDQDCYSITELTPGTQLARDIDTIHKANPDRAPALVAGMS